MVALGAYRLISRLKNESRLLNVANLEIETDNILDNIVFQTATDRALIVKIHNGGAKMYVGVSKYASVIEESISPEMKPIKDDWQKIKIDKEYLMLVQQLINDGMIILNVDSMNPSTLERTYKSEGVKSVAMFRIRETKFGFYFASFSSTKEEHEFIGSNEFALIELKVNRLRNIYLEADRKGVLH